MRPASLGPVAMLAGAVILSVSACAGDSTAVTGISATTSAGSTTTLPAASTTTSGTTPAVLTTTTTTQPPVVGPEPSPRVVAFYYPWYGTPGFGGTWVHWQQAGNAPPVDIGSDYYPVLGAYSGLDPAVVAQHMAWLRQAGVGVIATSWWGQGTYEDRAVPLVLDTAERYGIRVAFHIEPYGGRSAETVVGDVAYLYRRYGDHPAFFRSTERSRWSADGRPKGLFLLWSASQPHEGAPGVTGEYWREAVDAVHGLPSGGLMIADNPDGAWIDEGHFDGLYQYATLEQDPDFSWARTLPPGGWYIPSVLPGFSATRVGYDTSTYTARRNGDTYRSQWAAALGTGIEPKMVTITSFNEWHEGTQIEPAAGGAQRRDGAPYDDYRSLGQEGYLDITTEQVAAYLAIEWEAMAAPRIRVRMTTSSDWTTLTLLSGSEWIQPEVLSLSEAGWYRFEGEGGERLALFQTLADAEAGRTVELVIEMGLLAGGDTLQLRIERGGLGWTEVALGAAAESVVHRWDGWSDALVDGESGRNPHVFEVAVTEVVG